MDSSRYDSVLDALQDLFHRVWESAILKAALELGLFERLYEGPKSAEALAAEEGLDAKGVRIILDALCPIALVEKRRGRYHLTEVTACYLCSRGEKYVGPIHAASLRPERWNNWGNLANLVRGVRGPERSPEERVGGFRKLVPAIERSADYAAPLLAEHLGLGLAAARGWSILDAACGTGRYGILLARADPAAKLTLADFPGVLELAKAEVEKHSLGDRTEFIPGDLLTSELPERRFDLILLSHLLHSLGRRQCGALVRKLAAAQSPGGFLAVHEFVPDEERCRRRFPLLFAMNMYAGGGVGDTYTFSEIRGWMESAGYGNVRFIDTPGRSSFVVGHLA